MVQQVPIASVASVTREVAAGYLARDPAGNVEPLVSLWHDADVSAWGAWRGDALAGVGVAGRQWRGGPLVAAAEADDADAYRALLAALPPSVAQFTLHRAALLPILAAALPLAPAPHDELCYLTAGAVVASLAPSVVDARPLAAADATIVAASATPWGSAGFADALRDGYRPFGVVRDGRLVARAMAAYATGHTEEVAAVWTAHRWRGRGLATAVVAATAADILTRVPLATYAVRPDNLASRRVAEKVGFALAHRTATYALLRGKQKGSGGF